MSHLRNTWLVWRQGLMEILVYVPILLLIPHYTGSSNGEIIFWLLLLSVCYPLGYGVESLLHSKILFWRGLLTAVVIGGYVLLIPYTHISFYLFAAFGFWAARRGGGMRQKPWHKMFPIVHFWIGLFLYFATSFVYARLESMEYVTPILWYLGGLLIVLTVIIANRRQLKDASLPGKQQEGNVSNEMSLRNTIFLIILLAVVLLIGSIRYLYATVASAIEWLKDIIRNWLDSSEPVDFISQPPMPDGAPPSFLEGDPTETPRFLEVLQQILLYAIIGLAGIAVLFVLFMLGKALAKLWAKIKVWLSARGMDWDRMEKTGYVDEKESLIDLNKMRGNLADKWRDWFTRTREPSWKELRSNEERVRFIYRHVLQQLNKEGFKPSPDLSPSETLDQAIKWMNQQEVHVEGLEQVDLILLEQYYRARYSEHQVTDQEVETLRNKFKPV